MKNCTTTTRAADATATTPLERFNQIEGETLEIIDLLYAVGCVCAATNSDGELPQMAGLSIVIADLIDRVADIGDHARTLIAAAEAKDSTR